jgi:DNA (cytosine-5)-methyltransferase 1
MIVDLFAGGGGASVGIEAAMGRKIDVAINHDGAALAVHAANHPDTLHLEADVWEAHPKDVTGGRPVDLLWASPDCTHHSVAKGDVPRDSGLRSLAWVIVRWAKEVRPKVICMENVREFRNWGPLGKRGRPLKNKKGHTFRAWIAALRKEGYQVEHRILDASEFGAPTKRLRLFVVARCDGEPIEWPGITHCDPAEMEGDMFLSRLKPWRTAAECIDWSIPCPSIFERKKDLAEKTQWRIAQGIKRYVLENPTPFIINTRNGERVGQAARIRSIDAPLTTVTAQGSQGALVSAFLAKHFGGVVGQSVDRPASTVTATDHHALAAAHLVKFRGQCFGANLDNPMPTVTAKGLHVGEVRAFLTKYYSTGAIGQSLDTPAHTLTAKQRLGLVTVHGVDYQIADIGMRMLEPHELLAAQFGEFSRTYDLSAARTKTAKVRLIGNSVCPDVAAALVRANLSHASEMAA